jgi:hypothetical protein
MSKREEMNLILPLPAVASFRQVFLGRFIFQSGGHFDVCQAVFRYAHQASGHATIIVGLCII